MSDLITALINLRVPTLLIIAGLIFLFVGIATIKKPIVIDVTPSSRKIALGLGVVLVGSGLYLLSQSTSEQTTNMPTEIPVASTTETPVLIHRVSETPSRPASLVVYSSPDIVHLGDENVAGWAKLTDVCLTAKIQITLPIQEVTLSLETFGLTERALVKVNDSEIAVVPPVGTSNQDVWSDLRSFSLTTSYFVNGFNIVEICAVPLTQNASYAGEKDDFQIRNVQVSTK